MCGLVGILAKTRTGLYALHGDVLTDMLVADTVRGDDSTGIFGVTKDKEVDVVKGNVSGYDFIRHEYYHQFTRRIFTHYNAIIGHNRAATKGEVTAKNAHPFQEGKITLVHNGTIHNQKDLKEEVEVDSHAICHSLNENHAHEALESINGAFALIWYNSEENTLNLASNKQRPLWIGEGGNAWYLASEAAMMFWICGRRKLALERYIEVPRNIILQFDLNRDTISFEKIKYTDWKPKPVVVKQEPLKQYPVPIGTARAIPTQPAANIESVSSSFKLGQSITVRFDDYKNMDGIPGTIMLGSALMPNLQPHDNVLVKYLVERADMSSSEPDSHIIKYCDSSKLWTGIINGLSGSRQLEILFVNDLKEVSFDIRQSSNNLWYTRHQFNSLMINNDCRDCRAVDMKFEQVPDMFIKERRKGSGQYRIICPKCNGRQK